jgi:hypothetical protein
VRAHARARENAVKVELKNLNWLCVTSSFLNNAYQVMHIEIAGAAALLLASTTL